MPQRRRQRRPSTRLAIDPAAAYSAANIVVHHIPAAVTAGGRCRRTYRYRFAEPVPPAAALRELGKRLSHVMRVKPYDPGPDIEIPIDVALVRAGPRDVDVTVETNDPEEFPAFFYGFKTLPPAVERAVGRVESIEGHPRDGWLAFRRLDAGRRTEASAIQPAELAAGGGPARRRGGGKRR